MSETEIRWMCEVTTKSTYALTNLKKKNDTKGKRGRRISERKRRKDRK